MNSKRIIRIIDDLDRMLIDFVVQEKTNAEMAQKTGYSVGCVKRRLTYLFKLFGVRSKVGLIREIFKLDKSLLDI